MIDSVGGLLLKREYPSGPVVGVGAVIVDCGKLVLVKRGAEPSLGKWSFPGGAVELGKLLGMRLFVKPKKNVA